MPRVLVVDDQADVRAMICIVLRGQPFRNRRGRQWLRSPCRRSRIPVSISPSSISSCGGTNGFDLIRSMRERVPDLPVVAISGMTALDFLPESPELSNVVCLQKPFRPIELMRATEAARRSSRPSPDCETEVADGAVPLIGVRRRLTAPRVRD